MKIPTVVDVFLRVIIYCNSFWVTVDILRSLGDLPPRSWFVFLVLLFIGVFNILILLPAMILWTGYDILKEALKDIENAWERWLKLIIGILAILILPYLYFMTFFWFLDWIFG